MNGQVGKDFNDLILSKGFDDIFVGFGSQCVYNGVFVGVGTADANQSFLIVI